MDGAIHAQIGTRAGGKRALQGHIHRHRTVQNGGIDARYTALDQPVRTPSGQPCVDDGGLPIGYILDLGFRDLQLGLELGGLRHLAQRRTGHHLLAHLDGRGKLLQHAVEAGTHLQLVHLALLQVELPAKLLDLHLLGRQLRLFRVAVDVQALLLELHPAIQLLRLDRRDLGVHFGEQALLGKRLVAVRLELRGVVIRSYLRHRGLHIELGLLERDLQVGVIRLGGFQVEFGVQQLGFKLLAGQNHDHRIGLDRRARVDQDALHPAVGGGGDEHGLLGDQRAQAAHFEHDGTALDRVDPDRGPVDARRRRLQAREDHGNHRDGRHHHRANRDPADQSLSGSVFARYVHFDVRG